MISKERRLTVILEDYWNLKRGDRDFPEETEIDLTDLKDIWDGCFLVNVQEGSPEKGYKYSYLGQSMIDAYGEDISQDQVNVLIAPNKQRMIEKIALAAKTKEPVHDESEFVNADSVVIRYRKIFLPLGSHGRVKYVIGGMRWRSY